MNFFVAENFERQDGDLQILVGCGSGDITALVVNLPNGDRSSNAGIWGQVDQFSRALCRLDDFLAEGTTAQEYDL